MNTAVQLFMGVTTDDPHEQALALDAFNRCAVGLALQGVQVTTVASPAEDDE